MLAILNDDQKAQLLALGKEQENDIRRFAEMRLPLIKAFRRNLEGDLPAGSKGLDKNAVMKYSADLYELDGLLAFERAKVMGGILRGLSDRQKAALAKLKFGDSADLAGRARAARQAGACPTTVHVAVMTYASEMFAWYAGSLEADTYFCPERHGMYFGGFGMKTAPAMGKKNYSISTSLTGDSGEAFLATLTMPSGNASRTWLTFNARTWPRSSRPAGRSRPNCGVSRKANPPTRTRCCPCRDDTANWTARCRTSTPRPLRRSARR